MKTKVLFSRTQYFEIDVFIESDDNIKCIKDYIEDVLRNKNEIIMNNILEENFVTRVGLNTNLVYLEDDDCIEILNDEDIDDKICLLNEDSDLF